jgi:cysteine desulfurase
MHVALRACVRELEATRQAVSILRDQFEGLLLAACPELTINGAAADRLPQTSNVAFPGVDGQALMMALDLAGLACSTGSACASGSSEASPTLLAMGLEKELAESCLRFSLGRDTTAAEVQQAARRILEIYKDLRSKNSRRKTAVSGRNQGNNSL